MRAKPTAVACRARRRGFTVVEVAVAAALSSLLLLLVIRWVLSLLGATTTSVELAGATRDTGYLADMLAADFAAAGGCDPLGLDVPLAAVAPDSFVLYADVTAPGGGPDAGPDGTVDVVAWRVGNGTVSRAVVAGDGSCTVDLSGADWRTVAVAARAVPAGGWAVAGYRNGVAHTSPADYGTCTGLDAERCLYDTLRVRVDLQTVTGAPVSFDRSFAINLDGSRL